MDHVAIMRRSWGLLPKILSGEKIAESRWMVHKSAPWGKVVSGDIVYFKNTGEPVTVKAKVARVWSEEELTPKRVLEILEKYGEIDGIEREKIPIYYELLKNKKYCMFIYLKNVRKTRPFEIDKTGFGAQAAWICVEDIGDLKIL